MHFYENCGNFYRTYLVARNIIKWQWKSNDIPYENCGNFYRTYLVARNIIPAADFA